MGPPRKLINQAFISSETGLDQAVTTVPAVIKDIDLAGVCVVENEEIVMTQKAHLLQSLKLIHGC